MRLFIIVDHLLCARRAKEDLLRELARRIGAENDDPHVAIERLALATGFVKSNVAAGVALPASSKNNAEDNAGRDVRFSVRIGGIAPLEFSEKKQIALEAELAKGYGVSDGPVVRIVGISSGGGVAGLQPTGKGEVGEALIVDLRVTGYKSPAAAARFVKKANEVGVPLGKAGYGHCSFENPPMTVLAADQGGSSSATVSSGANVPLPPTIVAATPGDGEAKLLLLPPYSATDGGLLDTSVEEMEVISSPGRLRATGKPGEPIVVKGLTNGTTYRFTAHARNKSGWSGFSAPSSPLSPGDLTASPLPPEIAAVSTAEKDVEVNVLVAAAGKYFLRPVTLIEVKSEPDNAVAFAPPGVPVLLQNLRPNVNYRFRARAKNANGWSRSSKPTAPVGLLAGSSPLGGAPDEESNKDNEGSATQQAFTDSAPPDYFHSDDLNLDGRAKEALEDHMLERDLLRKGNSPLEVLLHKQRYKKDLAKAGNFSTLQVEAEHGTDGEEVKSMDDLSLEEAVKLNNQRQEAKPLCFTVKQEMNISKQKLILPVCFP